MSSSLCRSCLRLAKRTKRPSLWQRIKLRLWAMRW